MESQHDSCKCSATFGRLAFFSRAILVPGLLKAKLLSASVHPWTRFYTHAPLERRRQIWKAAPKLAQEGATDQLKDVQQGQTADRSGPTCLRRIAADRGTQKSSVVAFGGTISQSMQAHIHWQSCQWRKEGLLSEFLIGSQYAHTDGWTDVLSCSCDLSWSQRHGYMPQKQFPYTSLQNTATERVLWTDFSDELTCIVAGTNRGQLQVLIAEDRTPTWKSGLSSWLQQTYTSHPWNIVTAAVPLRGMILYYALIRDCVVWLTISKWCNMEYG